ncbi:response regulator [Belnapia sp. T18]|uniref:Response regulator n=1 Tax=Belnapia arida TaxID=2804533 RepID=A0ABS1UCX7_9PROT|nr:response regulator [Belnapia arida]MBL6082547.1 response regulator [Belnapia arida]
MVQSLKGVRVLVVEDEALIAMLIEDLLTEAGAIVLGPATTVGEALQFIERKPDASFDAVLLDLTLKGELAVAVADQLMAAGIPFMFVTGKDKTSLEPRHWTVPILVKPFDCDSLASGVSAMISAANDIVGRERCPVAGPRRTLPPKGYSYIRRHRASRRPRPIPVAIQGLDSTMESSGPSFLASVEQSA